MASADLPEAVGPRMTTRSGSGGVFAAADIHRAPQGMVLPKRMKAISRIKSTITSRPISLMRSRDFWRSYHSGDLGSSVINPLKRVAGGSRLNQVKGRVDAALKSPLRNCVVPPGLRSNFPLNPALRLRLRAGLRYSVPPALVFVPPVPPPRRRTEFRNRL